MRSHYSHCYAFSLLLCRFTATAGNTVAPGPRWDENRPGMFRVALFRDERASENRVEAHPTAPLSGSSVAYRLFNRGPCDGYRGPPSFAHEPLEL